MDLPKKALKIIKELLIKSIQNSEKAIKVIDDELETVKSKSKIKQLKGMREFFYDSIDTDKKDFENTIKKLEKQD
jgi:ABC-type phosphate transport system auxiliary subunit